MIRIGDDDITRDIFTHIVVCLDKVKSKDQKMIHGLNKSNCLGKLSTFVILLKNLSPI